VRSAVEATQGNVAQAAEALGIAENSLRKRIEHERLDLVALRAKRPPRGPVRVTPAHHDAIREARYDLQHALRVDLTDSAVLEMFIAEAFAPWLSARLLQAAQDKDRP
jgi:hypothetical protein